jgi:amino acid transporter
MFVGTIVCSIQFALGEVSALLPVTGSFVRHAEVLVDPALAFAIGWNIVYGCFLSVPSEISAAVVLIQYWTDINAAVWVTILIVVSVVVAISFIGVYGEVEFIFAILKILLVIFVVILGLVIDLGGIPGKFIDPCLNIEPGINQYIRQATIGIPLLERSRPIR